jgi:hypothetical protein
MTPTNARPPRYTRSAPPQLAARSRVLLAADTSTLAPAKRDFVTFLFRNDTSSDRSLASLG